MITNIDKELQLPDHDIYMDTHIDNDNVCYHDKTCDKQGYLT